MKKVFSCLLIIIFLGLLGCLFIKKDIPESYNNKAIKEISKNIVYPTKNKNITINGIDYLQSQAPIGNFGGELVISTIGEGPKTFNPCNTKDATSSTMAGLLYDGLLTTNPRTGEVEPLLAKSFSVIGNKYIINLRNGLRWTDGSSSSRRS